MMTGRRRTDWLSAPSYARSGGKDGDRRHGACGQDERRQGERRHADRRAPRQAFDPLFVLTLIDQIAAPEATAINPEQAYRDPRPKPGQFKDTRS